MSLGGRRPRASGASSPAWACSVRFPRELPPPVGSGAGSAPAAPRGEAAEGSASCGEGGPRPAAVLRPRHAGSVVTGNRAWLPLPERARSSLGRRPGGLPLLPRPARGCPGPGGLPGLKPRRWPGQRWRRAARSCGGSSGGGRLLPAPAFAPSLRWIHSRAKPCDRGQRVLTLKPAVSPGCQPRAICGCQLDGHRRLARAPNQKKSSILTFRDCCEGAVIRPKCIFINTTCVHSLNRKYIPCLCRAVFTFHLGK